MTTALAKKRARAQVAASLVSCPVCGAETLLGNRSTSRKTFCSKECRRVDGRARAARKHQDRRAIIQQARIGPCADCGRDDLPWEAMDLDHVPERGPKLWNLSERLLASLEKIEAELAKCDRVCPTCHRLRSLARGQFTNGVD